jgi:hypothetical protein
MSEMPNDKGLKETEFEKAGRGKSTSILGEFFYFLKTNKKYWMIPILLALVILGTLIILGSTAAAPFIYTLF